MPPHINIWSSPNFFQILPSENSKLQFKFSTRSFSRILTLLKFLRALFYLLYSMKKSASINRKRTWFKLNIKFIQRFTDVNYRPNSFRRSSQLLPRSTLALFSIKGRGLSLITHRGTLLLSRLPLIFKSWLPVSSRPNKSAMDIFQEWKHRSFQILCEGTIFYP